jgi:hypothetical protein
MVVNLGDLLARWSNDFFRSTTHRVACPVDGTRYSAVFFLNCNFHAQVREGFFAARDAQLFVCCTGSFDVHHHRLSTIPRVLEECLQLATRGLVWVTRGGARRVRAGLRPALIVPSPPPPPQVECITRTDTTAPKYPPIKAGHYMLQRLGLMWLLDSPKGVPTEAAPAAATGETCQPDAAV